MSELSKSFKDQKDALPKKIGGHEKVDVLFCPFVFTNNFTNFILRSLA